MFDAFSTFRKMDEILLIQKAFHLFYKEFIFFLFEKKAIAIRLHKCKL